MSHIFISHSETDEPVARDLGTELEKAGLRVWFHERDSLPGPTYLTQVAAALRESQAVIVLVSPASLKSHEVTNEIARAHQLHKPFVPVLHGITHAEFLELRDDWSQCFGAATSISIPAEGASAVVPRIVQGLALLGIRPGAAPKPPEPKPTPVRAAEPTRPESKPEPTKPEPKREPAAKPASVAPKPERRPPTPRRKSSPWLWVAVGAGVVIAAVLAIVFWPGPPVEDKAGGLQVTVMSWRQEEPVLADIVLDGDRGILEFGVEGKSEQQTLPAGLYAVNIMAAGFFPWTDELEVRPGEVVHREYLLLPHNYSVEMNRDDYGVGNPTDFGAQKLDEVAEALKTFPLARGMITVSDERPYPEGVLGPDELAENIRTYLVEHMGVNAEQLLAEIGPRPEGTEHQIRISLHQGD